MGLAKDRRLERFDEAAAREFATERLSQSFDVTQEVSLRSPLGESFRIDAVAICKQDQYVIGLEFKRSPLFMSDFADALRQACNYREAIIEDNRLPQFSGSRQNCCLVFPDWDGLHSCGLKRYAQEADGMRLLAKHFRVGGLRVNEDDSLRMILGLDVNGTVWHSKTGWNGNAKGVLVGKRTRGSATRALEC